MKNNALVLKCLNTPTTVYHKSFQNSTKKKENRPPHKSKLYAAPGKRFGYKTGNVLDCYLNHKRRALFLIKSKEQNEIFPYTHLYKMSAKNFTNQQKVAK